MAVNSLTVTSSTSAVANVTAGAGAAIGFRDVTVQTRGELANESVPGPLLVVAAPPPVAKSTGASPGAGIRGSTVDVTLTGANTTFKSGQSLVSLPGTGVQLAARPRSRARPRSSRGWRSHRVPRSGSRSARHDLEPEHAVLLDGFEVRPVPGGPGGGGPPGTCTPTARGPRRSSSSGVGVCGWRGASCTSAAAPRTPAARPTSRWRESDSLSRWPSPAGPEEGSADSWRRAAASAGARACAKPVWLRRGARPRGVRREAEAPAGHSRCLCALATQRQRPGQSRDPTQR